VKSCIAKESLGSACANTWQNWIKEAVTPASTISFLSRQSVKFLGSKSFHLLIQRRRGYSIAVCYTRYNRMIESKLIFRNMTHMADRSFGSTFRTFSL
jgi:hypothetical protein